MNILRKIKDWFIAKRLVENTDVAKITRPNTHAVDEQQQALKKRARKNFEQQEQQVFQNFAVKHEIGCDWPMVPCAKNPCFAFTTDKIVRRVKVKRGPKSVPVNKRFLD